MFAGINVLSPTQTNFSTSRWERVKMSSERGPKHIYAQEHKLQYLCYNVLVCCLIYVYNVSDFRFYRPSIFFSPHPYPLVIAVILFPAVFVFISRARRTLKRKQRVCELAKSQFLLMFISFFKLFSFTIFLNCYYVKFL